MMENDFGVEAVRLFDWLICSMKLKGAVKLPFLNVVKYNLLSVFFNPPYLYEGIHYIKLMLDQDLCLHMPN